MGSDLINCITMFLAGLHGKRLTGHHYQPNAMIPHMRPFAGIQPASASRSNIQGKQICIYSVVSSSSISLSSSASKEDEVFQALKNTKNGSAPSLDGLPSEIYNFFGWILKSP